MGRTGWRCGGRGISDKVKCGTMFLKAPTLEGGAVYAGVLWRKRCRYLRACVHRTQNIARQ